MFRTSVQRLQRGATGALKRAYTSGTEKPSAAHKLAEELLAQKTGNVKGKATLPKGDKKPIKAKGEKGNGMKQVAMVSGALTGAGIGGLFYYGRPFGDGREDKYVNENPFSAAYHRCVDRYQEFQDSMNKPMWDKLLPEPLPEPYNRPYTLVINMDETLVYSKWDKEHGWRHAKRPGVDYFLAYLSQFYEIVIFTSQNAMNAQELLEKLDPYHYAMYRLFREATHYTNGTFVKDLSHLNRDLSKVIIMDSNPEAFQLQPENGIALKPWKGEAKDQGLLEYIPFLEAIALTNPEDVRLVLKTFGDQHIPIAWAKREKEMNELHRIQWEKEQGAKKTSRNLGSLLGGGGAEQAKAGPPPTFLEQMRKHVRETFANEYEGQRKYQDEAMAQDLEKQKEMMKEMKMSVWDLMAQTASGQPILPPSPEGSQPVEQTQK
ncbi:NIF-domain-containing protein [Backusella circina FSU 941]|nr:NIF-domain-containing protein [Backusella circina FSU 941]